MIKDIVTVMDAAPPPAINPGKLLKVTSHADTLGKQLVISSNNPDKTPPKNIVFVNFIHVNTVWFMLNVLKIKIRLHCAKFS